MMSIETGCMKDWESEERIDDMPKSGYRRVISPTDEQGEVTPLSQEQVGGNHYTKHKIQPWDIIEEYDLDFWLGNVTKYILREKCDQLQDLKKARHYLDKKISLLEQE
jgi:hypothetical protein